MNPHYVRAQRDADENRRILTVDTPVHVIVGDQIVDGRVCEVTRGRVNDQGWPRRSPEGDCPYFVAEYINDDGDLDWCSQVYQESWFADIDDARRALVSRLRRESANLEGRLRRIESRIAALLGELDI